jgi:DNA-binding CsgD family transcriptional regulator
MNTSAVLTCREREITELIAWGLTKKDVAMRLFISVHTVDKTVKNVFKKTGVTKVNELSAWFFVTRFHISLDLSPLYRSVVAGLLLAILIPEEIYSGYNFTLRARTQNVRVGRVRNKRRDDTYYV